MKKLTSLLLSTAIAFSSAIIITTGADAAVKKPVIKKIINASSGVKLSWNKTGARKFTVQRSTAGKKFKNIKKLSGKFSYTDKKVKSGVKYIYRVLSDGKTSKSKKFMRLDTPKIRYIWSDACGLGIESTKVKGAKKYEFYSAEVKNGKVGKYKKIAAKDNIRLSDYNQINGKIHKYKVRAVNGKYRSAFSKIKKYRHIQIFNLDTRISNRFDGITVSWDMMYGASNYELYKSEDNKNFIKIADIKETAKSMPQNSVKHEFEDKDVTEGKTYYYFVKAKLESSYVKSKGIDDEITFKPYDKEMTLKAGEIDEKTFNHADEVDFGHYSEFEVSDTSIAAVEEISKRQYNIKALKPGVTYIFYSYEDEEGFDEVFTHRIKLTVVE